MFFSCYTGRYFYLNNILLLTFIFLQDFFFVEKFLQTAKIKLFFRFSKFFELKNFFNINILIFTLKFLTLKFSQIERLSQNQIKQIFFKSQSIATYYCYIISKFYI